jgi:hypothetical protein
MTENGTSITLNSTNNPHAGTTTIEATGSVAGDYFQAQAAAPIDLGDFDSLVFFIRSKAAWANAKQFTITARSSGTQVGSSVVFKSGLFAFDSSNTTTYQQIVIPASLFSASGQSVNQIRWTVAGGGGAIGFYVDDITLQGGLATVALDATRIRDRGGWVTDVLYSTNDMVDSTGLLYVALQAGMGKTPATNPTYWRVRAMLNPMTTAGDSIVGGASGVPARLALGSALQLRRVNAAGTAQEYAFLKADEIESALFAADAGSNDTYVATLSPAITAYVTGAHYRFKANTANTGACTIALNGLAATAIKKAAGGITTDLADNDIRAGQWVDLVYDGTNMQMQSLLGNAPAGGGGSPGGSDTQLQFNNAASFGGISGATSNGTSVTFTSSNLLATNPLIDASLTMNLSATARMFCGIAASGDAIITGSLTNDFCLRAQTSGNILFGTDSGAPVLKLAHSASGVNYVQITGGATTTSPLISAVGSATNLDLRIEPKGNGGLALNGTHPTFFWYRGGSVKAGATIEQSAGSFITGSAVDDLLFRSYTSGGIRFSTDNGGTLSFEILPSNGGVRTSAPSGGTAAAWKFGARVAATVALDTTQYIQLDVGGTLYKIGIVA